MIETVDRTTARMATWFECHDFLAREAACLDDDRPEEWLALLTPDVTYEVPIRRMTRRREDPIASGGWHMREDLGSLRTRVARLGTTSAWAEDPPSRTRRMVSNVRVDGDPDDVELPVRSNLLLYRGRGDGPEYVLIAGERRDVLRRTDDGLRLARRVVILSHTVLPTQNLGVFL